MCFSIGLYRAHASAWETSRRTGHVLPPSCPGPKPIRAGRHPSSVPARESAAMHSDPTDLIHRAQQGDRAAFEALYRAHAGRVYALCLRLTADAAQAEERTQDAFVRAWQRLSTFRGDSAFGSWLYRLTVNEVLLARRAERRHTERVVTHDDPAALERPPERSSGPGTGLDLERYRHDEIAKLAGIAVGTSKAQLFRARRLLREALNR